MELAHFDQSIRKELGLMVTAAHFQEVQLRKSVTRKIHGGADTGSRSALTPRQRAIKLQILNLAVDAAVAWMRDAAQQGVLLRLADGAQTVKLYPRLVAYDGDQPELVSLVGRTCYMCRCVRGEFGDVAIECCGSNTAVDVTLLRRMRTAALHNRQKTEMATLGMRNPEVNYRLWSRAHHPFVDSRQGGIAAVVRVDDLHVTVLGTVKKLFEDLQLLLRNEFGGDHVIKLLESTFAEMARNLPEVAGIAKIHALFSKDSPDADFYRSMIFQMPQALITCGEQIVEKGRRQTTETLLHKVYYAVHLTREVVVELRFRRSYNDGEVEALRALTEELRRALQNAFSTVRGNWGFPKYHTMSAFAHTVRERGIGRCYRGEAGHRRKKELLKFTTRRGGNLDFLRRVLEDEEQRCWSVQQTQSQATAAACRVRHRHGVSVAVTRQNFLQLCVRTAIVPGPCLQAHLLYDRHDWAAQGMHFVDEARTEHYARSSQVTLRTTCSRA